MYLSVFDTQWNTVAIAFTTAWQRFTLTRTASATSLDVLIGTDRRDSAQGNTTAQSVYLWGAQVEASAYARSYVATAGASATSNKDSVTFSAAALPVGTGSVSYEFTPMWSTHAGATIIDTRNGGGNGFAMYVVTTTLFLVANNSEPTSAFGALAWTPGTRYHIRGEWAGTTLRLFRDDVLVASATHANNAIAAQTILRLGDGVAGASPLDGHISNLSFRP